MPSDLNKWASLSSSCFTKGASAAGRLQGCFYGLDVVTRSTMFSSQTFSMLPFHQPVQIKIAEDFPLSSRRVRTWKTLSVPVRSPLSASDSRSDTQCLVTTQP